MLLAFTFWSHPVVFADSWVELASTVTLIAFVLGAYKHLECHRAGCHRIGRFQHGHYKLCRVHHPLVPNSGKVGQAEIDAIRPGAGGTAAPGSTAPPGTTAGPAA